MPKGDHRGLISIPIAVTATAIGASPRELALAENSFAVPRCPSERWDAGLSSSRNASPRGHVFRSITESHRRAAATDCRLAESHWLVPENHRRPATGFRAMDMEIGVKPKEFGVVRMPVVARQWVLESAADGHWRDDNGHWRAANGNQRSADRHCQLSMAMGEPPTEKAEPPMSVGEQQCELENRRSELERR